jgi:cell division protease FtsH
MLRLIKEIDRQDSQVIVFGLADSLDGFDNSLLRSGRFDQQVAVEELNLKGREAVIDLYLHKIKYKNINVSQVALLTQGFTGSDLKDLLAKATDIAFRKGLHFVTMEEVEEAREQMLLGEPSKTRVLTEQERRIVAYHEAGHAMMLLLAPEMNKQLDKITISPRGDGLGLTSHLNKNEERIVSRKEMLHDIMYSLGGRAAEELVFDLVSTTASSDLEYATSIAKRMICDYGMTAEFGAVVYTDAHSREIDACIKDILEGQYKKVMKLLSKNRKKLNLLAEALLEKDTLSAEEVHEIIKGSI